MPCLYGVATVTIDSHITGVAGVTVLFSTVNRERLRIFETEIFLKSLEQNFSGQKKKIIKKLRGYVYHQLKISPGFGPNIKKLRNWQPPTWRYRIGAYRFFYEIDKEQKIIFMTIAEHRGKAYKK